MTRARLDSVVTVLDADLFHALVSDAVGAAPSIAGAPTVTPVLPVASPLDGVDFSDVAILERIQATLPAAAWAQLRAVRETFRRPLWSPFPKCVFSMHYESSYSSSVCSYRLY